MGTKTVGANEVVARAMEGDREAFGMLFEQWFDRAFDVAWHIVRNRDTAAEVTQDAFVAAWQQIGVLQQPESFGGWLLRITRNKGLNRLKREQRTRPVGREEMEMMARDRQANEVDPAEPMADRERDDMLWVASAALGPDDTSLLSLHLRHGLDPGEMADEMGVERNAMHQRLFRLRHRLADAIGAWVLWQRGRPSCEGLRSELASTSGDKSFDRGVASAIVAHARGCAACDGKRRLRLSPEVLFGAAPIVAAGPLLRARTVAALEAMGVPTGSGKAAPLSSDVGGNKTRPFRWVAASAAAVGLVAAGAIGIAQAARSGDDDTAAGKSPPTSEVDQVSAADGTTTTRRSRATGSDKNTPASTTTTEATTTTSTTVRVVVPPSTEPPPEETTTTTGPPAPAPTIGGFRATRVGSPSCPSPGRPTQFIWSSLNGTSATIGPTGAAGTAVQLSGTQVMCAVPGTSWTLTVSGPGGSTSAETRAP